MALTSRDRTIPEKSTALYTAQFVDERDVNIALADLTTLTLTLFTDPGLAIINSRNAQNVLNANDATVSTEGLLEWEIQPADATIVNNTRSKERHVAQFIWTWDSGLRTGRQELTFWVINLRKLT